MGYPAAGLRNAPMRSTDARTTWTWTWISGPRSCTRRRRRGS